MCNSVLFLSSIISNFPHTMFQVSLKKTYLSFKNVVLVNAKTQ
jgi:hypothetical protein